MEKKYWVLLIIGCIGAALLVLTQIFTTNPH
jgi:hypothetical protein